ncbi:MAG: NUDIX hydrolase [Candidatus Latescibacterota bacterium]
MIESWDRLDSRPQADYGIQRVRCDRVRRPRTGKAHDFLVLEMPEWTNVVADTPERRVVLIRQYRHGNGRVGLEIPGGVVDAGDPSPAATARRELSEETGYRAGEVLLQGRVAPNPAIQNNGCHTFLALDARPGSGQRLDAGEDIEVEEVPLDRIPALILDGSIEHGLVVAAFHFLDLFRRRHPDTLGLP